MLDGERTLLLGLVEQAEDHFAPTYVSALRVKHGVLASLPYELGNALFRRELNRHQYEEISLKLWVKLHSPQRRGGTKSRRPL